MVDEYPSFSDQLEYPASEISLSYPFGLTHYLELKQCKLEGEHRIGVTACMYTRVFVIELLTGLLKANIKRIDALKDSIFAFSPRL